MSSCVHAGACHVLRSTPGDSPVLYVPAQAHVLFEEVKLLGVLNPKRRLAGRAFESRY